MASAKIHINLSLGLIEAEGDEAFVRAVYDDFKGRLEPVEDGDEATADAAKAGNGSAGRKRAAKVKKKAPSAPKEGGAAGMTSHKPKIDPNLDTSGLTEFMEPYVPKNNPERYVLYLQFLKSKKIDPATMDQLFSCFHDMNDDLPNAMGQNLIDTRSRYGYVNFTSPMDVSLSTKGMNHLKKIKKKDAK